MLLAEKNIASPLSKAANTVNYRKCGENQGVCFAYYTSRCARLRKNKNANKCEAWEKREGFSKNKQARIGGSEMLLRLDKRAHV